VSRVGHLGTHCAAASCPSPPPPTHPRTPHTNVRIHNHHLHHYHHPVLDSASAGVTTERVSVPTCVSRRSHIFAPRCSSQLAPCPTSGNGTMPYWSPA
jgi:hypothetical protein